MATDSPIPSPTQTVLWYGRPIDATDRLIASLITETATQAIDTSIADSRELAVADLGPLKQFATSTPRSSRWKLLCLTHVDRLSPIVANALLKLIEEPPRTLLIRLTADRLGGVLATIRSRCQTIFIGSDSPVTSQLTLEDIQQRSRTERLTLAESLARDDALESIVVGWLAELETELLRGLEVTATIRRGYELLERLRSNMNRRTALESWFLALPQPH